MTNPVKQRAPRKQSNVAAAAKAATTSPAALEKGSLREAVSVLFSPGEGPLVLRDGREITIHTGKTKHLGLLLDFFNLLLIRFDRAQLAQLVTLFVEREEQAKEDAAAKKAGKPVPERPTQSVEQMVGKVFDTGSLAITFLHAVNDVMPDIVAAMTNLSHEEYGDLPPDEGIRVAARVFTDNFAFFSQNLPPAIQLFLQQAVGKLESK